MGLIDKLKAWVGDRRKGSNPSNGPAETVYIPLDQDEAACEAVLSRLTNAHSHVFGEAALPFFDRKVRVELDPTSPEDIAFAKRQLALLNALPVDTYEQLCRHTVHYAADVVEHVGEYLGMFDDEDFADEILPPIIADGYSALVQYLDRWFTSGEAAGIVEKLEGYAVDVDRLDREHLLKLIGQAVLDLELYQDRFHHVWPAVRHDLMEQPLHILRFIRLISVKFYRLKENGEELLAACLQFDCDWEPEHGLSWSIVRSTGVSVCDAMSAPELTSACYEDYRDTYNYCFYKTVLSLRRDRDGGTLS